MHEILHGDSLQLLGWFEDNSVDAVVTDPPYGLSFMNKHWDYDVPSVELWREVFRVLKPGGHVLSFGGTRTYHRMVVNIEDAGFEIRDQLQWLYGSGFPKSHDVSKGIDKAAGAEREVVGTKERPGGFDRGILSHHNSGHLHTPDSGNITAPATDLAKQWQGWGTALKPANEPIVLARKPLVGTVAANVEQYGTGGLNIDASRIGGEPWSTKAHVTDSLMVSKTKDLTTKSDAMFRNKPDQQSHLLGRWPANVLFDEEAAAVLDAQHTTTAVGYRKNPSTNKSTWFGAKDGSHIEGERGYQDSGGASRFFYVAKASKRERGEGNNHPTVKPVKLMEYLVRLVTPPGGTVLDPFMGSGTTGVAARNLGFQFVGIEYEKAYIEIAKRRIEGTKCV